MNSEEMSKFIQSKSPSEIYLFQMEPQQPGMISEIPNPQVLPLHILENASSTNQNEQCLFLSSLNQNEYSITEDQLRILLNGPLKVIQVEDKYQPAQNANNVQVNNELVIETNVEVQRETKKITNYVHIPDKVLPPRAVLVLPHVLKLRNDIVTPRSVLLPNMRFGPVQGVRKEISHEQVTELISKAESNKTPLFLVKGNDCTIHIDTTDKETSNWFSLLPLGDESTANLWIYEEDGELYGITKTAIHPRASITIGYSQHYVEAHNFIKAPSIDAHEESTTKSKQWWCTRCKKLLSSYELLLWHERLHQREQNLSKRRYHCQNCTLTFSRLFTLKRHALLHCKKKREMNEKVKAIAECVSTKTVTENNIQPVEENRIPSDESFQNFSNSLDFPTSLFDDKMSGLDLSNSRHDFNPYALVNRDDNVLTSSLSFPNTIQTEESVEVKKPKPQPSVRTFVECPYCKKQLDKDKKRNHIKRCPDRFLKCECGKRFNNKMKLAKHIVNVHTKDKTEATPPNVEHKYKCDKCQCGFKRRGMLVNHLWRVHQASGAGVPLERSVRHYPCLACPKLYRTAAKRNRHLRIHHPDADRSRASCIESEVRVAKPAACELCPRQYATRAKLLQHQRTAHSHR